MIYFVNVTKCWKPMFTCYFMNNWTERIFMSPRHLMTVLAISFTDYVFSRLYDSKGNSIKGIN